MIRSIFYLIGALSLHFSSGANSPGALFLLTAVNILFFVFVLWETINFFLLSPLIETEISFADWIVSLFTIKRDILENGLGAALVSFTQKTLMAASYCYAIYYFVGLVDLNSLM